MSVLTKSDRAKIAKQLKLSGSPQAVLDFVNDIDCFLILDSYFLDHRIDNYTRDRYLLEHRLDIYTRTNKEQYKVFLDLLERPKKLLEVLKQIRGEDNGIKHVDATTVSLIETSLMLINREKREQRDASLKASALAGADDEAVRLYEATQLTRSIEQLEAAFARIDLLDKENPPGIASSDAVPATSSLPIVNSREELTDAIILAAKKVKPKRGPGSENNSNRLRKSRLADRFVKSYRRHFNQFPPMTKGGNVYEVFTKFLRVANLSEDIEDFTYRKAIEKDKETFKNYPITMNKLKAPRPLTYKKKSK